MNYLRPHTQKGYDQGAKGKQKKAPLTIHPLNELVVAAAKEEPQLAPCQQHVWEGQESDQRLQQQCQADQASNQIQVLQELQRRRICEWGAQQHPSLQV